MTENFKHIRDDKETRDSDNTLFAGVYILSLSVLTILLFRKLTTNKVFYLFIVVAIIYSYRLIRVLYKDWVRQKDIIGSVEFGSDRIKISNLKHEILVSNISSLKIHFNYIKGKQFNRKDIIHNGLATLTVDLKNKTREKIIFLIETKVQLENLRLIFKDFYKAGIDIHEHFCRENVKTFLLKADWKYSDIQKIKTELNIN